MAGVESENTELFFQDMVGRVTVKKKLQSILLE